MRAWWLAWQFLTRLPVRIAGEVNERMLAGSVIYYPAVGAALGVAWCWLQRLGWSRLPTPTAGWLLVAAQAMITGGLHLDGLADLTDGWFGSYDRERRLAIMRDSRIGALGAVSLLLVLSLKASLLATAPAAALVLVLYECTAKLVLVLAVVAFPYARGSGTGSLLRQAGWRQAVTATLIPLTLLLWARSWPLTIACGLAGSVCWLLAKRWATSLGGLTGDCYGALHEIYQVLFLLSWEVLR